MIFTPCRTASSHNEASLSSRRKPKPAAKVLFEAFLARGNRTL